MKRRSLITAVEDGFSAQRQPEPELPPPFPEVEGSYDVQEQQGSQDGRSVHHAEDEWRHDKARGESIWRGEDDLGSVVKAEHDERTPTTVDEQADPTKNEFLGYGNNDEGPGDLYKNDASSGELYKSGGPEEENKMEYSRPGAHDPSGSYLN